MNDEPFDAVAEMPTIPTAALCKALLQRNTSH